MIKQYSGTFLVLLFCVKISLAFDSGAALVPKNGFDRKVTLLDHQEPLIQKSKRLLSAFGSGVIIGAGFVPVLQGNDRLGYMSEAIFARMFLGYIAMTYGFSKFLMLDNKKGKILSSSISASIGLSVGATMGFLSSMLWHGVTPPRMGASGS